MKGFAPARRQPDIFPQLLMAMSLAFWLMVGTVAAQPSAHNLSKQVAHSGKAGPETKEKIDEAFKTFEELLAITRDADSMNGHLRVRLESWRNAQEAWEKASAALPSPLKSLQRCAASLAVARGMIEQADNLFRQARACSDPMQGADLLIQHQRLIKQAGGRLQRAERCYLTARNAYLKGRKVDAHSQVRIFGEP
jgi:tetratricopeptide (TPR) repeat protein